MSEGIIINPSFFVYFATITVTYPAGSTLTCTCGSDSFTAETTSGSYTFVVPYAGTWTVKATKGSQSKSANVSVTTYNQSASVTLTYAVYAVQNGVLASGATSYVAPYDSSVTAKTGYLQLHAGTPEGGVLWVGIRSQALDMGQFKTLYADFQYVNGYNLAAGHQNMFGISSNTDAATYLRINPKYDFSYPSVDTSSAVYKRNTWSLDISSVTGTNYANFFINPGLCYLYNFWLE